jgi:catechol 2,3-dioxygenase-like lactoylglutathione lyase family enzyme
MPLHRLTEITIGVPNVDETISYYTEFGLTPLGTDSDTREHLFGTVDGGQQLRITHRPLRQLLSLGIGVDDPDDLERIASSLKGLDIDADIATTGTQLSTVEPVTKTAVTISIAPRLVQEATPTPGYNSPGIVERANHRAFWQDRTDGVRPRKLGHVVIGSADVEGSQRFYAEGLGLRISDTAPGLATFLRCSADHHNLLLQNAPVNFLHHTAWEVDDIDEIGRGAKAMLDEHPERHVWGFGRHWVGSNFFYYLRDPAGNFTEYYSDMDEILDDQLWEPGVFDIADLTRIQDWGPSLPPSMLAPDDLAELMTGSH